MPILTALLFAFLLMMGRSVPTCADDRPLVGAIRSDAWYGEGEPVKELERVLSPRPFHSRLPFFARVLADDKISIEGNTPGLMEKEIAYAAGAGLNYWAFVDYGDKGDLTIARRRYLAARDKHGLRFCLIEESRRLDEQGTRGWPRLVSFFRDPNYQTVLDGRPLLFVFGCPKKVGRKEFQELGEAAQAAGSKRPYLVLMGFHPPQDAKDRVTLGFDAVSAYTAGGQYQGEMWSYARLTEYVRSHYWDIWRRQQTPVVTFATAGWDMRPRLDGPVGAAPAAGPAARRDPVTPTPAELARHLQDALEWTRDNCVLNPAHTIIIYAWNENDKGAWLLPTLGEGTARRETLALVLKDATR